MTDEAKALVERLRATWANSHNTLWNPDGPAAADLIETQAREIERLREALGQIAPHVNWMPHPHCLTVEQIIRAALGDSHDQ